MSDKGKSKGTSKGKESTRSPDSKADVKKDTKTESKTALKKPDDKKPEANKETEGSRPKSSKDQLKKERDEFKKDQFPFIKISQYGAPGYKEDFFRVRREKEEDWRVVYGCLFLEYFLIYDNGGSKSQKPTVAAEPSDFVRLDGFNYKLIEKVETRMVSGGLIPRKEKYENTFVVGYEELEMLIECKDQAAMDEWMPAFRNRVKHCLLAKKEFGDIVPADKLKEVMEAVPREQEFLQGPQKGNEEKFITQVAEAFQNRNSYLSYLKHMSFFVATYSAKTKPYIDWFISTGASAGTSLEKEIWDAEDQFVTGGKGWKGLGIDFTKLEREMKRVNAMKLSERTALIKLCEENVARLKLYNKYMAEVHQKPAEYDAESKKWETAKASLEQWIQKDKDNAKAEEDRLKSERKKELQVQKDKEKEAARVQEVALANPLSDVNVFVTVDDPFADVQVSDVLNEYGEIY
jgi:hypothetical protein